MTSRRFFFFFWVMNSDGLFVWAQRGWDHLGVWGSPSFLLWARAQALPCWSLRRLAFLTGYLHLNSWPVSAHPLGVSEPILWNIDRGRHIILAALIFKVLVAFRSTTSISSLLNFWCNSLSKEMPPWRVSHGLSLLLRVSLRILELNKENYKIHLFPPANVWLLDEYSEFSCIRKINHQIMTYHLFLSL